VQAVLGILPASAIRIFGSRSFFLLIAAVVGKMKLPAVRTDAIIEVGVLPFLVGRTR
jgi:hypothetical protein